MEREICPYFGICGGCNLQNISYDEQIKNKLNILRNSINFEEIGVFYDKEFYYRNRMDFVFHKGGLGLRKKGTWKKIVDIERCLIANEKINNFLFEIRDFFGKNIDAFDVVKHSGTFRYAVIRVTKLDSSVSFVLNSDSSRLDEAIKLIKDFSDSSDVNNIIVTRVPSNKDVSVSEDYFIIKGRPYLKESYLDKEFLFPIQGFFQNNYFVAERMHGYVKNLLSKYSCKNFLLLDLYAGVGTFGIINSSFFKKVIFVESYEESIEYAKKNALIDNVSNAEFFALDAKFLKRLSLENQDFFVITDPPRSGMDQKTIEALKNFGPEIIIYVSCNYKQLSKDIPKFRNYKIRSVALFDMFPQTIHFESVVELSEI